MNLKKGNKALICENCGCNLEMEESQKIIECKYCHTKYAIEDLINKDSDNVKIEKIRTDFEREKWNKETANLANKEEQDEVKKFKKSFFSKVLLVFFAFAVLFFFIGEGLLCKLLTIIQAGCFMGSWLMGMKIVKEPKKGIRTLLSSLAFMLIIPVIITVPGPGYEKIDWNTLTLAEVLPTPKGNKAKISYDSDDVLSVYVHKQSKENYKKYIEACKEKGFTIDLENDTNQFEAYNKEGYKLNLYYDENDKVYHIDLDAPIEMNENAWISTTLTKQVPNPKSTRGKVMNDSSEYFRIYVGDTSKEEYISYVNKLKNAGFVINHYTTETHYDAYNKQGYKVSVSYEGGRIMEVYISAPSKEEPKSNDNESITEENVEETDKDTDFRDMMDSYEAFFNDYVEFMKEYEESDDVLSLMEEYSKMMSKYVEIMQKMEEIDEDDLSSVDALYYVEVNARISKKLSELSE